MALLGRLARPVVLRAGARNAYIYTEKIVFGNSGGPLFNPAPVNSENPIYRNTEIDAAIEKAKGDWKNMTPEEVKLLYKMHFLENLADSTANTGEVWRIFGQTLFCVAISIWVVIFYRKHSGPPKCETMTYTHKLAQLEQETRMRVDVINPFENQLFEAMKPDLERQREKLRAELQLEEKYRARIDKILAEKQEKGDM